jgi:hypothetical protein
MTHYNMKTPVENTPMFSELAAGMGIRGRFHKNCHSTRVKLSAFGLTIGE